MAGYAVYGNPGFGGEDFCLMKTGPDSDIQTYSINPTPTATPSPEPSATTILVTTSNGAIIHLTINGNITSSQMSNIALISNKSSLTTTLSFSVTGQSGTTGFSNITIPKSAVVYGTTPKIYIDTQTASSQGYTQDANNYYVWYITQFSTHQITIVFSTSSSIPEFPSASLMIPLIISIVFASVLSKKHLRKVNS
jgi:hypothetical protein